MTKKQVLKKYDSEQEFCKDVTKLILGILVGEDRKIICVPEVPYGFYSNNHIDMMLLDIKNLELLFIEYKLNIPSKLSRQVRDRNNKGLKTIGIINTNSKYVPDEYYGCSIEKLFSYTGRDGEIENISRYILNKYSNWSSVYTSNCMTYYWAYKKAENCLNGGIKTGGRETYFHVYKRAIRNLHKYYGKLGPMYLTHKKKPLQVREKRLNLFLKVFRVRIGKFLLFALPCIHCKARHCWVLWGLKHSRMWANYYSFGTNAMYHALFFFDRP